MNKLILLMFCGAVTLASCDNKPETAVATADETTEVTSEDITQEVSLQQVWATDSILETPESVYFYEDENILFVSNIVGEPSEKDGKGYISKVSLDGQIVNKEWVKGLDAPKGMAVMNGTLYVTNIDELVAIDISSGMIKNRYKVENAKFLNDPVVTDNKILFTDMKDNKIYAFQDGKVEVWKEKGLENPNGLAYNNGNVLLASNKLQVVNQAGDGEVLAEGIGFGDGIGVVDENSYLVSNWEGEVYYVEKGKEKVKLLDTKAENMNTADITYIQDQNLLLVPTFNDHRVVAYKLNR